MLLQLPDKKRLVHETTVEVRWGDMDAMGHVNNTLYFRYLESVRIEWMHKVGAKPDPAGEGPLIVNAFCNFHKQVEFPARLHARLYTSAPGRSAFESWCTLERDDQPGVVYASGGATVVWVNFPQERSAPLPTWLRDLVDETQG